MKKLNEKEKKRLIQVGILFSVLICIACIASDIVRVSKDAPIKIPLIDHFIDSVNTSKELTNDLMSTLNINTAYKAIKDGTVNGNGTATLIEATVLSVIDETTFVVAQDKDKITVRLTGVEASETVFITSGNENHVQEKKLAEIVRSNLSEGSIVYLEYDVSRRDEQGNTLAYVYFQNGKMMQEWLLENGYARSKIELPNNKYEKEFAEIQSSATKK